MELLFLLPQESHWSLNNFIGLFLLSSLIFDLNLSSNVDTSAAYNIGRVLADRCVKSGIYACITSTDAEEVERSDRKKAFYAALEKGGIKLEEPKSVEQSHENDPNFTWTRFPVKHTREDRLDDNPLIRK